MFSQLLQKWMFKSEIWAKCHLCHIPAFYLVKAYSDPADLFFLYQISVLFFIEVLYFNTLVLFFIFYLFIAELHIKVGPNGEHRERESMRKKTETTIQNMENNNCSSSFKLNRKKKQTTSCYTCKQTSKASAGKKTADNHQEHLSEDKLKTLTSSITQCISN